MVGHEGRISAVETEVRHMRQALDEMRDTLQNLVEDFHEFRGEAKTRWELDDEMRHKPAITAGAVLKDVIIILVSALLALVGVKMGLGGGSA